MSDITVLSNKNTHFLCREGGGVVVGGWVPEKFGILAEGYVQTIRRFFPSDNKTIDAPYRIIDGSGGLILIVEDIHVSASASVWNPMLNVSKQVNLPHGGIVMGFGYNVSEKTFNVLIIISKNDAVEYQMYSLEKEKWTIVAGDGPGPSQFLDSTQVIISPCTLSWLDWDKKGIWTFGLTSKSFKKLSLPSVLENMNDQQLSLSLGKIHDRLAFGYHSGLANENVNCSIYLWKNNGWVSKLNICFPHMTRIVLIIDEKVVVNDGNGAYQCYDIPSEHHVRFGAAGADRSYWLGIFKPTFGLMF